MSLTRTALGKLGNDGEVEGNVEGKDDTRPTPLRNNYLFFSARANVGFTSPIASPTAILQHSRLLIVAISQTTV